MCRHSVRTVVGLSCGISWRATKAKALARSATVAADSKLARSVPPAPISANGEHRHAQPLAARIPPIEFLRRRRAWTLGPNVYRVLGRDGRRYYLVGLTNDGEVVCNCAAGSAGRPCIHAVVVLRRLLRELRRQS